MERARNKTAEPMNPARLPVLPWIILLWTFVPVLANADIIDAVNVIRQRGCDDKPGVKLPLQTDETLNEAAREWSKGGRLKDALARVEYRMVNSASMHIEGAPSEREVVPVLVANYCATILDTSFTEIGAYERKNDVWIVVATPFAVPGSQDAAVVSRRVLELVNQARAAPRKCGNTSFRAVPPLKPSALLERAAHVHALDMAEHNFFQHEGSDGSHPADRATRAGYKWRTVGENIAAGARDADSVVRGWLGSPGHCVNIMGPQFSEMGVAYAFDNKSDAGIYWSQVFASPRRK
jgi:uncharacterized protein YkwD